MNVEDDLENYIWGQVNSKDYLKRVVDSKELEVDVVLHKVSQIDDSLNKQLRKEVEKNLSRLLEQTTALEALDRTQQGVHTEMNDVYQRCDKFATSLDELLLEYKEETEALEKSVKLRNMIEDAMRCEDLMESFEKRNELVKRSEIICELHGIIQDNPDLLQVSWLKDTITVKLKAAENEVRRMGAEDLRRALVSLNASIVASATRALKNLGVLEAELEVQLSSSATQIDAKLSEMAMSTDVSKILPVCINMIHSELEQCVLLGQSQLSKFTEKLARIIRARIPIDAPFTLKFVQNMGRILQARPECSLGPLDDAMRPLKASILSVSLQRLYAIIEQHDFSTGHANAFVDVLNAAFEEELTKVEFDGDLHEEMLRNVKKSLEMTAKRLEMETRLEPETLLFGDRLSAAQLLNYRLLQSAATLTARWPAHAVPLVTYQNEVLTTVFDAVKRSISTIVNTMHKDALGGKNGSPYMQELCSFMSRVILHCAHMGAATQQRNTLGTLANYAFEHFILHATLVRPLTSAVRDSLRYDFSRLLQIVQEMGLADEYSNVEDYISLFEENVSLIRPSIPLWAVIHILIADSPDSLLSPHKSMDWTIEQYVEWCDEHSPVERLAFLNSLVSSYASSVVAKGETEYVPHYPLIIKLLKKGMQS